MEATQPQEFAIYQPENIDQDLQMNKYWQISPKTQAEEQPNIPPVQVEKFDVYGKTYNNPKIEEQKLLTKTRKKENENQYYFSNTSILTPLKVVKRGYYSFPNRSKIKKKPLIDITPKVEKFKHSLISSPGQPFTFNVNFSFKM